VDDFLRLISMARRHGAWMLLALMSMAIAAGATVFTFNLIRPVYDQVLRPVPEVDATPPAPATGFVGLLDDLTSEAEDLVQARLGGSRMIVLGLALMAVLLKNLATFIARFAAARFGLATVRDLRTLLFGALLGQSPGYFHATPTAVLVSRATNDVQLVREALAERFGDLVQDVLTVLVLSVYLLSLNLRLALATVVLAPILFAPVVHFSRRLRIRSRQAQEQTGELATVLDEAVRGIRIVQTYGMADFLTQRFFRANHRQYLASLSAHTIRIANAPVMEVVGAAAALGLIAYASAQIAAGFMTLGDFSAFLLAAYGAYNPLKRLNKFNLAMQQASVAAGRVFSVVDAPVAIRDRGHAVSLEDIGTGIVFDGVGFTYDGKNWVLQGFNLELPRGWTVALVGVSGAGKSTVAQLIPRFWDVCEGSIRLADHDLRDLRLASLRAQIGLVTQETILFNDSVRRNILCGTQGVSDREVVEAARAADAHDFVSRLPHGYETVIGEAGVTLSGGQRQRLAIARALLKDPPILILDEATSALDPGSELEVQAALERLMCRRTSLVIAHRLATVRRADRIVVLSEGRIMEQGRHDELIAAGGTYRRMVEMQELT